jgi:hypothetical protein
VKSHSYSVNASLSGNPELLWGLRDIAGRGLRSFLLGRESIREAQVRDAHEDYSDHR